MGVIQAKYFIFLCIFLFFYVLCIFVLNISNSQFVVSIEGYESFFGGLKYLIYLPAFVLMLLFYRFNKFSAVDFIVCVIFLISYYFSRITIVVFIFFLFVKYVDFKVVVKAFLVGVFTGVLFVFVTSILDLYNSSFIDMHRADGTYRHPLGYKYPTYLPNVSLYVYLCWFFLRKNNITLLELVIISCLNFVIYELTDTRTIFYLVNLLLVLVFFVRSFSLSYKSKFFGSLFSLTTIYIFLILSLVTISVQVFYNPDVEWMDKLNKFLSGRLYYGNKGYIDYGISLLGQKIEYVNVLTADASNRLFVIDSGFMKVLMDYGLLLYVLIVMAFIYVGRLVVLRNDVYMGIAIVVSLLDIAVNPHLVALDFNPFFFALAYVGKYKENLFK